VVDLNPLIGLFFPAILGGINTGDGAVVFLLGEGEPSTLDAAVDEDAFEEVDENEFVELPDIDRNVFATKLGIDFADDDGKDDEYGEDLPVNGDEEPENE